MFHNKQSCPHNLKGEQMDRPSEPTDEFWQLQQLWIIQKQPQLTSHLYAKSRCVLGNLVLMQWTLQLTATGGAAEIDFWQQWHAVQTMLCSFTIHNKTKMMQIIIVTKQHRTTAAWMPGLLSDAISFSDKPSDCQNLMQRIQMYPARCSRRKKKSFKSCSYFIQLFLSPNNCTVWD